MTNRRRSKEPRPTIEQYKMALAVEIAARSNCLKSHVGAILLVGDRIRSVGYNGTVEGYRDCFDGGCPRCKDSRIRRGQELDRCICVHAEENALVSAARFGIPVEDSECYVTHEPCLGCTKLLIQAHVKRVVYLQSYEYPVERDHNDSRGRMRCKSAGRKEGVVFEQYNKRWADPQVVNSWGERLKKMRDDAEQYAKRKGVLRGS